MTEGFGSIMFQGRSHQLWETFSCFSAKKCEPLILHFNILFSLNILKKKVIFKLKTFLTQIKTQNHLLMFFSCKKFHILIRMTYSDCVSSSNRRWVNKCIISVCQRFSCTWNKKGNENLITNDTLTLIYLICCDTRLTKDHSSAPSGIPK